MHLLPSASGQTAQVKAGYYNWWNIGIAVSKGRTPCTRVTLVETCTMVRRWPKRCWALMPSLATAPLQNALMAETNQNKWQRNKYSVYADLALGALFFLVGKFTEDLALAAIVGAGPAWGWWWHSGLSKWTCSAASPFLAPSCY